MYYICITNKHTHKMNTPNCFTKGFTNMELFEQIEHRPNHKLCLRTQDANFGYVSLDPMLFKYDLQFRKESYPCMFTVTIDSEYIWIEAINPTI